jgi:hypothetical protein
MAHRNSLFLDTSNRYEKVSSLHNPSLHMQAYLSMNTSHDAVNSVYLFHDALSTLTCYTRLRASVAFKCPMLLVLTLFMQPQR